MRRLDTNSSLLCSRWTWFYSGATVLRATASGAPPSYIDGASVTAVPVGTTSWVRRGHNNLQLEVKGFCKPFDKLECAPEQAVVKLTRSSRTVA